MPGRIRLSAADAARVLGTLALPKRHKYGAAPATERTYNGVAYHSKAEAQYAADLDLQMLAGQVRRWERQVAYPLVINGTDVGTYRMDFRVWYADGRRELVEVKGFATAEWRFKWKVFLACWEEQLRAEGWTIVLEWRT
jgi:hypothetical protein